uniref:Lysophospholipid acyltransferase 5 n=1 Tax=Amphimedon queenslandica TaxID=400682 RepID=A0A1X7T8S0_AMPQE
LSASLHFLLDVILVYCVYLLFGKGRVSLLLTLIITMGHLTFGYVIVISSNQVHPIFWTIPHCVLVLKLIEFPVVISYIRYKHFISSILFDYKTTPSSLLPGLQCLLLGILTAVIYSQFGKYFPLSGILSEEYQARSLLSKLLIMIITGKLALWHYMAVWTFAGATCVIMGISYNKSLFIPEYTDWTAVYNVNFWNNETSSTLQ